jgi:hypothetical protein
MSERDVPRWSAEGSAVAAEVSERVRSLLADAEATAVALRHQGEQEAQARRRDAETEALKIIEDARREAERFLAERVARVSQLSDEILARGQSVVERLDAADEVRSQIADLVLALGETAARLANEVRSMPGPRAPEFGREPVRREWAEPEPAEAPAAAEPRSSEPEPDTADADEPLRAPTPLRPQPVAEPEPEQPAPAAEADVEEPAAEEPGAAEPDEAGAADEPADPTAEEAELIAQVKAAERERGEGDEAEASDTSSEDGNGGGVATEVVEIRATEVVSAGAGPDQALGARLVALQMAVAGGNRGEVEAHLRRAFDLDEPGAILDDIFGTGTMPDKRVAWPEAG